jgi:hypothetical protein
MLNHHGCTLSQFKASLEGKGGANMVQQLLLQNIVRKAAQETKTAAQAVEIAFARSQR